MREWQMADLRAARKIADFSLEAFNREGFKEVTVAHISKGMGMSKKTVYKYFESKEDLLVFALQDLRDRFVEDLERQRPRGMGGTVLGYSRLWRDWRRALRPEFRRWLAAERVTESMALREFEQAAFVEPFALSLGNLKEAELLAFDGQPKDLARGILAMVTGLAGQGKSQMERMLSHFILGLEPQAPATLADEPLVPESNPGPSAPEA